MVQYNIEICCTVPTLKLYYTESINKCRNNLKRYSRNTYFCVVMSNNNKVQLTITYGNWRVDTSINEKGEETPATIIMDDKPDAKGKYYVKAVKLPMVFKPIGNQTMMISKEALYQAVEGVNPKNLVEYNIRAIAVNCGIKYHSHSIL